MSSLPNNPELRLNDRGGTVGPFGRSRPLTLAAAAPPRTGGKKTHPGKAILAGKSILSTTLHCTCTYVAVMMFNLKLESMSTHAEYLP